MPPYRAAVIGLGNAAHTLHLPAFANLKEKAVVVGGCDPDEGRRAKAAERWKMPVFADYDEMMVKAKPDLIVVGTPPDSHADYCFRSLAAGADVICEKPFVSSVEEADAVIAAAKSAGRHIALNHEFREMPIFRALRDAAGKDVVFAQVWQLMDLPPWAEPGWRGQMLQRTLYEAGVHLVDFLMALFQERPVSVSATVSTCGVRDDASDAVALTTLEFSRGRLAHVIQNRLCKGETQYFEVRAETPTESLRASYGGRMRVSAGLHRSVTPHLRFDLGLSGMAWSEKGHGRRMLGRNPKEAAIIATTSVFDRTIDAFRNGGTAPATAEDGRDGLAVISACYHSAASGKRLRLDDLPDSVRTLKMGAAALT